jgi:hypothetical protein
MKKLVLVAAIFSQNLSAELSGSKFFVGTSAFMLVNLVPDLEEPPRFAQLNVGYQISKKDTISAELITWRYYGPLGIPATDTAAKKVDKFPGDVTSLGMGLAYQRFLWGGLYSALHAVWFDQSYRSTEGAKLGSGKQLFMTARLGYHFSFASDALFIEPSLAVTHWPIDTNLPASFQQKEDKWPKYAFEPGLHVGYVF